MEAIIDHLRRTIGLDPASIGLGAIERAVNKRIAFSNSASPEEYRRLLEESPAEFHALTDALIVPETWFFRDRGAFDAVAAEAQGGAAQLRYLCVPCATGEEPLSLAMTLLDAGTPPERFHIDAFDISARLVAHAERGVYGRNSFRGNDAAFRSRYFQETREGCAIDRTVRAQVTFRQANLLDDSTLRGAHLYDAIFCRNLLIYFDAGARSKAVEKITRLLRDGGLLCVAAAETGLLLRRGFMPAEAPQAFAFRKAANPAAAKSIPSSNHQELPAPVPQLPLRAIERLPQAALPAAPKREPKAESPSPPVFADAMRLADEGRLAEVSGICRAHIEVHGASADAYYLLALVSDASARYEEAAALYRKALYLDPQHRDALAHFSLLAEKLGQTVAAGALRQRALRLEPSAI